MSALNLLCAKLLVNTGVLFHHALVYGVISVLSLSKCSLNPHPRVQNMNLLRGFPQIIRKQGTDHRTGPSLLLPD